MTILMVKKTLDDIFITYIIWLYEQEGTHAAYVTLYMLAPCRLMVCVLTYRVNTVCTCWFPCIFGCDPTWCGSH